jgi:hypothetical protein
MIKKAEKIIINLPSLKLNINNVQEIKKFIKSNRLGEMTLTYNKQVYKNINDLLKINKNYINDLKIEIKDKSNDEDDIKIFFSRVQAYISCDEKISSLKFASVKSIEEILIKNKLFKFPRNIAFNLQFVAILLLCLMNSLITFKILPNLPLKPVFLFFILLFYSFSYLGNCDHIKILLNIKNTIIKFYFKYSSKIHLLILISIYIFLGLIIYFGSINS